jgi:Tol biopolymer transport system component
VRGGLVAALILAVAPRTLVAQFGRNKLQHQTFDFEVIRTAHFDVHFYPRERQAALDAARMAERAYSRLSRILGHEFDERKPVILYASHSQFQQTNTLPGFISEGTGGVTEFTKRRVIIPFTGSYAEFERVLTHELVHAFQYDVIARGLSSQLNPLSVQIPLWFVEGMAEYLALGGTDPHTEAWMRDAVLSGYLRTIPEMSLYSDYLSYRFGQSLWAFVGAKYGDETIGWLLQRGMRLGVPTAFEVTLGISLEQLSQAWLESVRTAHLPEVPRRAAPSEYGNPITDHAFRPRSRRFASYLSPALSPDGDYVVFLSDRGNELYSFYDLWLAKADGTVLDRLVESERTPDFESLRFLNSSAAWSPDGRRLAFVAQVDGRDAIYLYDVERRRVLRRISLTLDGAANPTFSPDGRRIAFTGLLGGISDLYVVDVEGRELHRLTDDRYADLHPAWSPDGRFIAIATDRGAGTDFDELVFGNLRIALYDLSRDEIEILPGQERGRNVNPAWSPDGQALAFVSDRDGLGDVYIWSLAEERLYRLTHLLSSVSGITPTSPAISWAADADRLAFTYFEGAGYNIYTIDRPDVLAHPLQRLDGDTVITAERDGASSADGRSDAGRSGDAAPRRGEHAAPTSEDGSRATRSYYRTASGLRPSAFSPEANEGVLHEELTVAALLEDAHAGLPDTAAFEEREYRPRLTPDVVGQPVIGAQVGGYYGNGVYGGSYVLLSDMLGDHNVLLFGQIAGSFNDAYILTRYTYRRERANLSMAYQQFPLYRFRGIVPSGDPIGSLLFEDRFLRDVYRTLSTDLSYPFSTFHRLEISAVGAYVSRDSVVDRVARTGTDRTSVRLRNLLFAGPAVAFVWDNALFGFTGPISGRRIRLEVGRYFGDVPVNVFTVDFRNYWNLFGRFALATRLSSYARLGSGEREFRVYWGGPYFIRGYDGGSFNAQECTESLTRVADVFTSLCPVRDQLIGSSVALASAEFRFPIFGFLDLGFVPLGLPPVDGVLFFDVGSAFNSLDQLVWSRPPGGDPVDLRAPLAAYGVGLRINILYNVVRIDYAVPLSRPDHRSGVWSLSFGPTF